MLRSVAVGLLIFGTMLIAEEPKPPKLSAPAGWTGESIALPPGFAPDMKLKGTEHIRFAPGMMKPGSDSFFCYAFVFELQPKPELTAAVLKEEFLKYYRGLCLAVLNGKLPELDPSEFKLDLQPVKADGEAKDAPTQYTGTLDWVEPFASRKPQKLNLEIHTWTRNERNFIFVCVSPQDREAAIWKQLHTIRDDYLKQQTISPAARSSRADVP